jgi:hypothetical protein
LAPGLPRLSLAAWRRFDSLATATTAPAAFEPSSDNLWARVQQAADSLPERPLRVFTLATQRSFRGTRPALPAAVRWQVVPLSDSSTWLQAAYQVGPDSLRLLLGTSNEAATTFRTATVATPPSSGALRVAGFSSLRYEARSDGAVLRLANSHAVPVQAAAFRLAIYHDAAHAHDASYLRAALRAASLGLPTPPLLTVSTTPPTESRQLDWLFWLSDAPVPAAWQAQVKQGLHLWREASVAGIPTTATLAYQSAQPIRLLRRDTLGSSRSSTTLWADGLGQPVLTRVAQGQGATYHLHTRLHPAWSELGSSAELPTLLLPLLQPEASAVADLPQDRRTLAPSQVFAASQTAALAPTRTTIAHEPTTNNLRAWAVALAALLFGLERWLARRRVAPISSATV